MNKSVKKIGQLGALAILSQIPVVAAFSKFFEDFVQDDWQERIDLWKESVIQRLSLLDKEMEQKIRETSNFASILATAQRGALEDMEEDKVALYVNAVVNSIKNEDIDDTKKHIFLNMLRNFTLLHIRILSFFSNIETNMKKRYPDTLFIRAQEAEEKWHEIVHLIMAQEDKNICKNIVLYKKIYAELLRTDLLKGNNLSYSDGYSLIFPAKQTTILADEFLEFINEHK